MPNRRIEDVVSGVLKGDAQKNALEFVAYLRHNGIPLEESDHYWEVKYRDECVCFLWITGADERPGPWTIWSAEVPGTWASWHEGECGAANPGVTVDEHIKEIAWANVNVCGHCGGCSNPGGMRKTVLGRSFDHLCNATMAFTSPDNRALECAKRMIDMRKGDIERALGV